MISFKVTFELPEAATEDDAREYVLEAVQDWCGQLRPPKGYYEDDPGDPMFEFDPKTVTVEKI